MVDAIILIILLWIIFSIFIWTLRTGITPMPTTPKVRKALLDSLPTTLQGNILELGSGWGTLAFPLSKKYPNQPVIGYELSFIPFLFSFLFSSRKKFLQFKRKNFYDVPLQGTGLIVCYLYPEAMRKLKEKFVQELSPQTLIVTHTFAIPGWTPSRTIEVDDLYRTKIYHYRVQ